MTIIRVVTATLITLSALPATPVAAAGTCTGRLRYASTSNTIYLSDGTATLSEIDAACPNAPLTRLGKGAWRLDADLVVENGATLVLKGGAAGGDVDTLRLRSSASNRKTEVSAIIAEYGTILIEKAEITSWDPATGGPDTDPSLPANAPYDARGRAFIRVTSFMDGATPRESRMDIVHSDLGHLGFHGPESYGVSYKGRGCDASHPRICDALNVYGKQIGSRFHHNYFGVYTYNAYGMKIIGNEYDHNIAYGLDPHDDSDHLTIAENRFHHNGNHGLICSKRCDHLLIADNESYANGAQRRARVRGKGRPIGQVHGIMLHAGVTHTIVENNRVRDHLDGAGIAIYDSAHNVVRNNTISNVTYGLRYSVGARDIETTGNVVTGSGRHAVFTYRGSERPVHTAPSGRPAHLLFAGNTFDGAGGPIVRIHDSDGVRFVENTFTGRMGPVRVRNSTDTTFVRNTGPSWLLPPPSGGR
ncbi:right-handed parallel beta-helix repeat-containing protein [Thermopolyspora sp. NPDC052614]|uniref:right-handed parallel beta-helix repeat-containing protein n=1 Tax=Thermopolyspora sp. NPDC052614 TaxID=3155682 RepID=UPI00342C0173